MASTGLKAGVGCGCGCGGRSIAVVAAVTGAGAEGVACWPPPSFSAVVALRTGDGDDDTAVGVLRW
jgi:hypothetical protein